MVKRAHRRCLEARAQYWGTGLKTVNAANRDLSQADLEETVMVWFETLVPHISGRPGEVKQLWEAAPLYPADPITVPGLVCPNDVEKCGFVVVKEDEDHNLQPGSPCPYCELPLEPDEVHRTDESGRVLHEWKCGLKRMASWTANTKKKTVQGSQWETGTEVVEVPVRRDPEVLKRVARYLDKAAEKCGLIEETNDALMVAEI